MEKSWVRKTCSKSGLVLNHQNWPCCCKYVICPFKASNCLSSQAHSLCHITAQIFHTVITTTTAIFLQGLKFEHIVWWILSCLQHFPNGNTLHTSVRIVQVCIWEVPLLKIQAILDDGNNKILMVGSSLVKSHCCADPTPLLTLLLTRTFHH